MAKKQPLNASDEMPTNAGPLGLPIASTDPQGAQGSATDPDPLRIAAHRVVPPRDDDAATRRHPDGRFRR